MELTEARSLEKSPFLSASPSERGEKKDVGTQSLGKESFLRLLIAQLEHQDPLSPMGSTEFVTQLAQFSQLEQATAMNQALTQLVESNISLNNYAVAGLVGRGVQIVGGSIQHVADTSSEISYLLAGDAETVMIQVSDQAGSLIRMIESGPQNKGVWNISWDGRDHDRNLLPSGEYEYTVSAVDSFGAPVNSTTYISGRVDGVTYNNGVPYLIINGANIPASALVSIIN